MLERALRREIVVNKTLCRFMAVLVFVVLTALGAFVRIPLPFTPVPLTLQTFFVLLSAALLGRSLGITAQISYIFLGILGLPIFTGAGSGLMYLLGPTGGYLFGFVLVALIIPALLKFSGNSWVRTFGVLFFCDCVLLFTGTLWLKLIMGASFKTMFLMGFIPFLAGDSLKAALAASIYLKINSRAKEALF